MDASQLDECAHLALSGRFQYLGNDRYHRPLLSLRRAFQVVSFYIHDLRFQLSERGGRGSPDSHNMWSGTRLRLQCGSAACDPISDVQAVIALFLKLPFRLFKLPAAKLRSH